MYLFGSVDAQFVLLKMVAGGSEALRLSTTYVNVESSKVHDVLLAATIKGVPAELKDVSFQVGGSHCLIVSWKLSCRSTFDIIRMAKKLGESAGCSRHDACVGMVSGLELRIGKTGPCGTISGTNYIVLVDCMIQICQ